MDEVAGARVMVLRGGRQALPGSCDSWPLVCCIQHWCAPIHHHVNFDSGTGGLDQGTLCTTYSILPLGPSLAGAACHVRLWQGGDVRAQRLSADSRRLLCTAPGHQAVRHDPVSAVRAAVAGTGPREAAVADSQQLQRCSKRQCECWRWEQFGGACHQVARQGQLAGCCE